MSTQDTYVSARDAGALERSHNYFGRLCLSKTQDQACERLLLAAMRPQWFAQLWPVTMSVLCASTEKLVPCEPRQNEAQYHVEFTHKGRVVSYLLQTFVVSPSVICTRQLPFSSSVFPEISIEQGHRFLHSSFAARPQNYKRTRSSTKVCSCYRSSNNGAKFQNKLRWVFQCRCRCHRRRDWPTNRLACRSYDMACNSMEKTTPQTLQTSQASQAY